MNNERLVLAERPEGIPQPQHFQRDDQPVPDLRDGEFLMRNRYLSIDPAQRGWVNAAANYSNPVGIGEVMRSLAVGEVVKSKHTSYSPGDHLYGWFGWQRYCVATPSAVLRRVDPGQASLTAALGVLGINGLTAYLALTTIGEPERGDVVVVSTAAGAVGSVVGQVASALGCDSVGITGSAEKVSRCTRRFGYRAAIDYKNSANLRDDVAAICPNGVDVFFDNTAGDIADAVVDNMNKNGRIIQCGTASIANWDPPPAGPRRERQILVKCLRQQGFIIFDHIDAFDSVAETLATWIAEGKLSYDEDMEYGLDSAPAALAGLYAGANHGKKIIAVD